MLVNNNNNSNNREINNSEEIVRESRDTEEIREQSNSNNNNTNTTGNIEQGNVNNNTIDALNNERQEEQQAETSIGESSEESGRIRCGDIKIRGGVPEEKEKGLTRLFSANCNGLGPDSADKIRTLGRKSKELGIDGALISSVDTHWDNHAKTCSETKLKAMHAKLVFNASDSKETVNSETNFLKGGTSSMFWGVTQNFIVTEENY